MCVCSGGAFSVFLGHWCIYRYRLQLGHAKRIWYLSPMRAAKVQASLRIRAVSPEPSLLAHTSSESRGTFRQKARSVAPLNVWACAVKICHDGLLEDTNSLGGAQLLTLSPRLKQTVAWTFCRRIAKSRPLDVHDLKTKHVPISFQI